MESSTLVSGADRRADLSHDQPLGPAADAVIASAVAALEQGETHYVETGGIAPLIEQLKGLVGAELPGVLVTAGVQEARFLAIQIVGDQLGGVALPAVVEPGAPRAAKLRPLNVATIPAERAHGYLPTLAAIRAVLEAGTKLVYLESPSRLTGAIYDAATVAEIAALLVELDGTVIWDQGLAPWVHAAAYTSISTQPGMGERAIVIGEAWPGVGLESWYVGYLAASNETVGAIRTYKQIISICTSTAAQYGAIAAAKIYPEYHSRQLESLAETRESSLDRARARGLELIEGSTANIVTVAVADVAKSLAALAAAGIAAADGAEFGAPGLIRLAATSDDTVLDAIEHLATVQATGSTGRP
jgi:aspartate/methionine/tyrosine aminotransferase